MWLLDVMSSSPTNALELHPGSLSQGIHLKILTAGLSLREPHPILLQQTLAVTRD